MLRKFAITVAVIVNLSNGYKISAPGAVSGSFSGSSASSSASAYSSSSSSSFSGSFNGDLNGNEVNNLLGNLKSGNAGFVSAGASAQAAANSAAEVSTVSDSGVHTGSSGCSNGNSGCTGKSTLSGGGTLTHTNYVIDDQVKTNGGLASGNSKNAASYSAGSCLGCRGPFPGPSGSIHDYKLATPSHSTATVQVPSVVPAVNPISTSNIYSSKPANAATPIHSVTYGEGPGYHGSVGTNKDFIQTLPGSAGSIYSSKPVSHIVESGSAYNTVQNYAPSYSGNVGTPSIPIVGPACSYRPGSPHKECGPLGNIGSSNVAVSVPGTFPGPTGSIHDSKPAHLTPLQHGHVTGNIHNVHVDSAAAAEAASQTGGAVLGHHTPVVESTPGIYYIIKEKAPVISHDLQAPYAHSPSISAQVPCSTIGCQNIQFNCNGAECGNTENTPEILLGPGTGHLPIEKPSTSLESQGSYGSSTTASKEGPLTSEKFPGPTGSIHSSKPIHNVVGGASSVAQAGAQAGAVSYSESGLDRFSGKFPGPVGTIYDSKPIPNVVGEGGALVSGHVAAPSHTETGKFPGPIGSIHDSKPIQNVVEVGGGAGVNAGSAAISGTYSTLTPVKYPTSHFPGGSGSIHESKPASNAAEGSAYSGSALSTQDKIVFDYPLSGSGIPCFSGSCGGSDSGYATGQVTIQKNDGSLVSGEDDYKLAGYIGCTGISCNNAGQKLSPFGLNKNGAPLLSADVDLGGYVGCTGSSCKNAGQKSGCLGACTMDGGASSNNGASESGPGLVSGNKSDCSGGSCFGANQASGQDIFEVDSKNNQHLLSDSIAGSYSGTQSGTEQVKHGFASSNSFASAGSASGFGGTPHFGTGSAAHAGSAAHSGSAAYSKAGAFSGSSAGSYSSASAHASSFASAY
ncbi:uncharacterized protein LOC132697217 isoform X3 [Cylas formicarius]|uniref:uncharacterized protein LOC132697217 isoform X3 n=1 Tax=Cylas formicarius TaxID=197179 RepID=UPI0029588530|nr:uncharacterized protein LOC132697217 isoform X3 [Cylas formicarius]